MRSYRVVIYVVVILLLCTCMYGCSSKETGGCVKFSTYNLESAQKVVPFTLILPTYLPSNLSEHIHITGDCSENNEIEVNIGYKPVTIQDSSNRTYVASIDIHECNYRFDIGDPALNPDIKNIEIDGFEVRESGHDQGFFGPGGTFSFASWGYSWNHSGTYFVVLINGYDHEEAIKVVESMIQQMQ